MQGSWIKSWNPDSKLFSPAGQSLTGLTTLFFHHTLPPCRHILPVNHPQNGFTHHILSPSFVFVCSVAFPLICPTLTFITREFLFICRLNSNCLFSEMASRITQAHLTFPSSVLIQLCVHHYYCACVIAKVLKNT